MQVDAFGHPSSEFGGGVPQLTPPESLFTGAPTGSAGSFGDPCGSTSLGSGGAAFSMGTNKNACLNPAQARARRRRK